MLPLLTAFVSIFLPVYAPRKPDPRLVQGLAQPLDCRVGMERKRDCRRLAPMRWQLPMVCSWLILSSLVFLLMADIFILVLFSRSRQFSPFEEPRLVASSKTAKTQSRWRRIRGLS